MDIEFLHSRDIESGNRIRTCAPQRGLQRRASGQLPVARLGSRSEVADRHAHCNGVILDLVATDLLQPLAAPRSTFSAARRTASRATSCTLSKRPTSECTRMPPPGYARDAIRRHGGLGDDLDRPAVGGEKTDKLDQLVEDDARELLAQGPDVVASSHANVADKSVADRANSRLGHGCHSALMIGRQNHGTALPVRSNRTCRGAESAIRIGSFQKARKMLYE